MQKALLISIIVATLAIPMWTAQDRSARRGLRRAVVWMALFNVVYLLAVMFIYPRL